MCYFCSVLVYDWLPAAYIFAHLGLLLVGIWASQDRVSIEPVVAVSYVTTWCSHVLYVYISLQFVVVLLMTMLIDIILLGIYFDDADKATDHRRCKFQHSATVLTLYIHVLTHYTVGMFSLQQVRNEETGSSQLRECVQVVTEQTNLQFLEDSGFASIS